MHICLVCEGCYPYMVGGVSSWVQQLITIFPEHTFSVYAIGVDSSQKGAFQYTLPSNLIEVQEVFLTDAYHESSFRFRNHSPIKPWEMVEFKKIMMGDIDRWDSIFDFFAKGNHIVASFLMSKDLFSIVREVYESQYQNTVYTEFLWTVRSMYLTLFHILNNPPHKADLYHCVSTGYAGIAGALAKRIYGGSLLITEHGIYTREREEEIIKSDWVRDAFKGVWIDYFRNLSRGAYNMADRVVALFETNTNIQIENGANPVICLTIPNGIRYKNFENLPQKTPDDAAWYNVGATIRVSPIKDIKTMLYAFDLVKRKLPNTRFYIMGPDDEAPEYSEECQQLLRELGTEDVLFTGRVQIPDYLGRMDVMVLTSISEAQPLSLMEAMAAGKPCVSTNVGSCKELFFGREGEDDAPCGLLAPIMHYEQISNHIEFLLTHPEVAKTYGENGRKRIRQHYTEEQFYHAYDRLYKDLNPERKNRWQG